MPPLKRGQRALSVLTVYAMIGMDYITTNGVSYKDAFEALFSPQFRKYTENSTGHASRLIHFSECMFEDVDEGIMTSPQYAEGMWCLFQLMLMISPVPRKSCWSDTLMKILRMHYAMTRSVTTLFDLPCS